jgi:hypothetical protein
MDEECRAVYQGPPLSRITPVAQWTPGFRRITFQSTRQSMLQP